MNYIFVTSLFPKELSDEIAKFSKGNIANAANIHQWNIVKGFSANTDDKIYVVNAPLVGSYPKFFFKKEVRGCEFNIGASVYGISVGYLNLPIIKNVFIQFNLESALYSLLHKCKQGPTTIYVYGMYYSYMKAAIKVKRRCNNVRLCLIVPDLPEYLANSSGLFYSLRETIQRDAYDLVNDFDGYVLLTDAMATRLNIQKKPWIRLEGMIDSEEHGDLRYEVSESAVAKKVILYSGTLAARYGIVDLLDAFNSINNPEYELWICGAGDMESTVRVRAENDKRIKFFGLISREKVLHLQRCSTILANPRSSKGDYTKYSFPSKTMEYMLSGRPIVMRRLPGIPQEYDKHIIFASDDSIEMLKNAIVDVCEMQRDHREKIGRLAREFVLKEKNYIVQGKRILDVSMDMNELVL